MERKVVSDDSFTIWREQGVKRCACGNDFEYSVCKTIYDDGTIEHRIRCEECKRQATAEGDISEAIRVFNQMNEGVVPIRFSVESTPEIITLYVKDEDNVAEMLKKELYQQTRLRRFKESDFELLLRKQKYVKEADVIVNNYAFKVLGEKVEVFDLDQIFPGVYFVPSMEMLSDGTILICSKDIEKPEIPQKIWMKLRNLNLGATKEE